MKKIIKKVIIIIIYLGVLPSGWLSKLIYKLFKSSLVFDFFAQGYSLVPGVLGVMIRACFYQQTLAEAHLDLFMGFGSFISKINTKIGQGVLINGHSTVGLANIGDGVVIANYVSVLSGGKQHNFENLEIGILEKEGIYSCVNIGNDVFIGDQSVVMADIGEKTIVGAGSIVVKEIPSYVVAVGNPARVAKKRK